MDKEVIQKLAKEAVQQFKAQWVDTPYAQVVEQEGTHVLIVKLSEQFPYASLHLNLEERCEKLLTDLHQNLADDDRESEDDKADLMRRFTYRLPHELIHMATRFMPSFLVYSLTMVDLLTHRERVQAISNLLDEHIQASVTRQAGILTRGLLQLLNLTEKRKRGASSVIDDGKVLDVLLKFRGEIPSIRQLAKELNTEPATIRNWLRKKGYTSLQELAKHMIMSFIVMGHTSDPRNVVRRLLKEEGEGKKAKKKGVIIKP
ncbi:MAG TPA: hypothetical protein VF659_18765 [Pyrinomonadaceae bacterium]|jgi:hypothetical protein